jgi:hypothetical protein
MKRKVFSLMLNYREQFKDEMIILKFFESKLKKKNNTVYSAGASAAGSAAAAFLLLLFAFLPPLLSLTSNLETFLTNTTSSPGLWLKISRRSAKVLLSITLSKRE